MLLSEVCQFLQSFRIFQFMAVSGFKLMPFTFFVVKPLPQLGRWGHFFQPLVNMRLVFSNAARPQPVDQQPVTVAFVIRLIYPFDMDCHYCWFSFLNT